MVLSAKKDITRGDTPMRSTTVRAFGNTPAELEADAMRQGADILAGLHFEAAPNYIVQRLAEPRTGGYMDPRDVEEGKRRAKTLTARIELRETEPAKPGQRSCACARSYTCARCGQIVPGTHNHSCGKDRNCTYAAPSLAKCCTGCCT